MTRYKIGVQFEAQFQNKLGMPIMLGFYGIQADVENVGEVYGFVLKELRVLLPAAEKIKIESLHIDGQMGELTMGDV